MTSAGELKIASIHKKYIHGQQHYPGVDSPRAVLLSHITAADLRSYWIKHCRPGLQFTGPVDLVTIESSMQHAEIIYTIADWISCRNKKKSVPRVIALMSHDLAAARRAAPAGWARFACHNMLSGTPGIMCNNDWKRLHDILPYVPQQNLRDLVPDVRTYYDRIEPSLKQLTQQLIQQHALGGPYNVCAYSTRRRRAQPNEHIILIQLWHIQYLYTVLSERLGVNDVEIWRSCANITAAVHGMMTPIHTSGLDFYLAQAGPLVTHEPSPGYLSRLYRLDAATPVRVYMKPPHKWRGLDKRVIPSAIICVVDDEAHEFVMSPDKLFRGGFSNVQIYTHAVATQHSVALKITKDESELRISRVLENIICGQVRSRLVGRHHSDFYFIMPAYTGSLCDLRVHLGRDATPSEIVRMLLDIRTQLRQLASAGILYRDVKPGNILFRVCGSSLQVAVGDLGSTDKCTRTYAFPRPRGETAPIELSVDFQLALVATELILPTRPLFKDEVATGPQRLKSSAAMREVGVTIGSLVYLGFASVAKGFEFLLHATVNDLTHAQMVQEYPHWTPRQCIFGL